MSNTRLALSCLNFIYKNSFQLRIVTVAILVVVAVNNAEASRPPSTDSCRNWCKRPGYPDGEGFYCCDRGIGTVGIGFEG